MSWQDVNLSEVSPTSDLIPASLPGERYTLEILGAQYRSYEGSPFQNISVRAAITEGESSGRQVFLDYPDPEKPKCEWSVGALKRLEIALGQACAEGQDKVEWLNACKGLHVAMPIGVRTFKNQNDEEVTRNQPMLFKVTAAA